MVGVFRITIQLPACVTIFLLVRTSPFPFLSASRSRLGEVLRASPLQKLLQWGGGGVQAAASGAAGGGTSAADDDAEQPVAAAPAWGGSHSAPVSAADAGAYKIPSKLDFRGIDALWHGRYGNYPALRDFNDVTLSQRKRRGDEGFASENSTWSKHALIQRRMQELRDSGGSFSSDSYLYAYMHRTYGNFTGAYDALKAKRGPRLAAGGGAAASAAAQSSDGGEGGGGEEAEGIAAALPAQLPASRKRGRITSSVQPHKQPRRQQVGWDGR